MHEHSAMKTWVAEQMHLEAPLSMGGIVSLVWGALPRERDFGVGLSGGPGEVAGGLSVGRGLRRGTCEEESCPAKWRCTGRGGSGRLTHRLIPPTLTLMAPAIKAQQVMQR